MEDHAFDWDLGLEGLDQMPGDGLPFPILISGQVKFIGCFQSLLQVGDGLLLVFADHIVREEAVVHVDAELAIPGLVLSGDLRGLGQVADMPDGSHHRVTIAQVSTDLPGFGRRLHNHEFVPSH